MTNPSLLLAVLCALFLSLELQAQNLPEAEQETLKISLDKDNLEDFQKLVKKHNLNLQQLEQDSSPIIEAALAQDAYKIARYIYQNSQQDADALLNQNCPIHTVACYKNNNQAAFEFLALLLRDAKKLELSPALYLDLICRRDMFTEGYEYGKVAILVLVEKKIDLNPLLIYLCDSEFDDIPYLLWLIEQGANPQQKIEGRSAYELASPAIKAAMDKQAAEKKAQSQPSPLPKKEGKPKKKRKKS